MFYRRILCVDLSTREREEIQDYICRCLNRIFSVVTLEYTLFIAKHIKYIRVSHTQAAGINKNTKPVIAPPMTATMIPPGMMSIGIPTAMLPRTISKIAHHSRVDGVAETLVSTLLITFRIWSVIPPSGVLQHEH
jgi:hypothetical protein